MTIEQARRLERMLPWAQLAGELLVSERPYEQQVHLRPSASSIRLVDLRPGRPQRDCGEITRRQRAVEQLRTLLANKPHDAPARPTPEKKLQSFLIDSAYRNARRWAPLSQALTFITDEQVLLSETGQVVCDLLAMRSGDSGDVPVVIELKTERHMKRLAEQLEAAAGIVDAHRDGFAQLFGAILSRDVTLAGPCERWLVWPATSQAVDPRADELAKRRIVVKCYREQRDGYSFS